MGVAAGDDSAGTPVVGVCWEPGADAGADSDGVGVDGGTSVDVGDGSLGGSGDVPLGVTWGSGSP